MRQEEYKALVQTARETDLVAYFQQNGFTVERKGSEYYVKEYPSLCINLNRWFFYVYYPAHMAVLLLIKAFLMPYDSAILR